MFRFGSFAFEPKSGELTRDDTVIRLTPQTAQVLQALIERNGEVVSRIELRDRVWPDTTVEFDQGLNFCIRQLRIALDDDASSPRFIETLPRRGYRFLAAVRVEERSDSVPETVVEPAPAAALHGTWWRTRASVGAGVALVLLASVLAWRAFGGGATEPRLAVVPFDASAEALDLVPYRDALTEAIVERVTNTTVGSMAVLGPSTTHMFGSRTIIDSIRERTGASYALSGVVRHRGNAVDVFAQLIRASDRKHIWVARWLDSSTSAADRPNAIGRRVADSVVAVLLHPDPRRRLPR